MNSALTPDSFTDNIKKLVQEGKVSHDVQTNEASLQKAAAEIAKDGSVRRSVSDLQTYADKGNTSPEAISKAVLLYEHLTDQLNTQKENGNVDPELEADAESVYVSLSNMATASGRSLQLYNLFRKMTPEGQVRILQQEIEREVSRLQNKGNVKKEYQAQIDPELLDAYKSAAEDFQKAGNPEAKKKAEQEMQDIQNTIYAYEASKMPTTFKAKWDAWRYMAMMGNAKTQIRNLAGNTLMMPYTEVKRKVGAILEKGISKDKRTKAVFQDPKLIKWAESDSKNESVKSALENSAKLGDDKKTVVTDNIKTFGKFELLNKLEKSIQGVTSWGDMIYKNREYARSLAGFLKARGYTATDAQSGSIDASVLNEAREYAINESLKATFNDSNALSDALSSLRYTGENKPLRVLSIMGEGLMPFRKTPANVVVRFKDYSPVGLIQGAVNLGRSIHNGDVSAATAIDQISSGLTGTGAMLLGYALAGGLANIKIVGSGVEEDEKRQGHQNYSVEITVNGETISYTIDWASPANLPLFLGANLRQFMGAEDTASGLTAFMNMGMGALEPLLELSCMSSLNDLAEGLRYAEEGEAVYTFLSKAATSYFTQGVPAVLRQATQAATETKQSTFVTSDDPVTQKAQKAIAGIGVGNPFKTDKVNEWGEKETEKNAFKRAFNAFFNPGTVKTVDNSDLEKEISRLNKAQTEHDVSPQKASKVISYTDNNGTVHNDVRLTEEQYQTYAATQGQTASRIIEDLISSKDYAAMSDRDKAAAIKEAYKYAKEKAEIAAIGESHTGYSASWMQDLKEGNEAGEIVQRVVSSNLTSAVSAMTEAWAKGYDTESRSGDLEWAYDTFADLSKQAKREIKANADASVRNYIEARENGVDHDRYLDTVKKMENIKPEQGNKNARAVQKAETIAKTPGLTAAQKELLIKQQVSDSQDQNIDQVKALGYGVDTYVKLYRDYEDYTKGNGKKARTIAKWQKDYSIDYATAKKLYEVFS